MSTARDPHGTHRSNQNFRNNMAFTRCHCFVKGLIVKSRCKALKQPRPFTCRPPHRLVSSVCRFGICVTSSTNATNSGDFIMASRRAAAEPATPRESALRSR